MSQMIAMVSATQSPFQFFIACEIHGMCWTGSIRHDVNASNSTSNPFVSNDSIQRMYDILVVRPRVRN